MLFTDIGFIKKNARPIITFEITIIEDGAVINASQTERRTERQTDRQILCITIVL